MYEDDANAGTDETTETAEGGSSFDMLEPRAFGLGLVIGAIVGASAAILLAPDSGTRTRRKLRRSASRLYSRSGSMLEELADMAERRSRELRKEARRSVARGMKSGRGYADEARDYARSARRNFGLR